MKHCRSWFIFLLSDSVSTFGLMVFCFLGPKVIFIYLFGHLVFYLFSPLDLVYWSGLLRVQRSAFTKFLIKLLKHHFRIFKAYYSFHQSLLFFSSETGKILWDWSFVYLFAFLLSYTTDIYWSAVDSFTPEAIYLY